MVDAIARDATNPASTGFVSGSHRNSGSLNVAQAEASPCAPTPSCSRVIGWVNVPHRPGTPPGCFAVGPAEVGRGEVGCVVGDAGVGLGAGGAGHRGRRRQDHVGTLPPGSVVTATIAPTAAITPTPAPMAVRRR